MSAGQSNGPKGLFVVLNILKKIVLGVILLLVVVGIGIVIFLKTFDVNAYLPKITAQIGTQIGRDVGIKKARLDFSWSQGVTATLDQVSIAEDPHFGKEDFLTVEKIELGLRLIPLVTKREIQVGAVEIRSPRVHLLRDKHGHINAQTLGPAVSPAATQATPSASSTPPTPPPALPPFSVESFDLKDAEVSYTDETAQPPLNVAARQTDAHISGFSLTKPFQFSVDAAVLSSRQNIHVSGTAKIDLAQLQVRLDDVRVATDLSQIAIDQLIKTVPALEPAGLKDMAGKVQVTVGQLVAGVSGILVLSADGKLVDGSMSSKLLKQPLDHIQTAFDMSESRLNISDASFKVGSGTVKAHGAIKDYLTDQALNIEVDCQGVDPASLLDQTQWPASFSGLLNAQASFKGSGLNDKIVSSLTGQAKAQIVNGLLANTNVLKLVLGRIAVIPGLEPLLEEQLPDQFKAKLASRDTKIDTLSFQAKLDGGKLTLNDVIVEADGFGLKMYGTVGLDQTLALSTNLEVDKDLSASMVTRVAELKGLVDESERIRIPVHITGKFPALAITPDAQYLGKTLAVEEGKKQLNKVLDKNPGVKNILNAVFGGGEQPAPDASSAPADQTAPQGQDSKPPDVINQIFNKIF